MNGEDLRKGKCHVIATQEVMTDWFHALFKQVFIAKPS